MKRLRVTFQISEDDLRIICIYTFLKKSFLFPFAFFRALDIILHIPFNQPTKITKIKLLK